VLGLSTAVHPVVTARHYQPAQAVPPAVQTFDRLHPAVVTTDLGTTTNAGPTQQLLIDRHAGVYPGPKGVHHRDGGCKDAGSAEYTRGVAWFQRTAAGYPEP